MRYANKKKKKVQRLPSALLANLKEGVLLNCLAFRDIEDGLIVPGWLFDISRNELNYPEVASDKDYSVS